MTSSAEAGASARTRSSLWSRLTATPQPGPRRYLFSLLYVAAATVVAEILFRIFDTNRLSMIFLSAVLLAGIRLGAGPAFFAALAAFLGKGEPLVRSVERARTYVRAHLQAQPG